MNKAPLVRVQSQFDQLVQAHPDEANLDFWFVRDLYEPLGYARWENFLTASQHAIESCKTTGYEPKHHFRGVTKLITHGKGAPIQRGQAPIQRGQAGVRPEWHLVWRGSPNGAFHSSLGQRPRFQALRQKALKGRPKSEAPISNLNLVPFG